MNIVFLIPLLVAPTKLAVAVAVAAADGSATTVHPADFIRRSCVTTLYPDLCYRSLRVYAAVVQNNPTRLATVAMGISFSDIKSMYSYLSALSGPAAGGSDPRAAGALRDCLSVYGDAVYQLRGSIREMRGLTRKGGEAYRFQIGNVQTWMSAAITDEDTCTEGFVGVPDGPIKAAVFHRTAGVTHVTSNALALVNNLVGEP